ncbi:MAG: universal stress protein [Gaiella sp.]|nr:universal stress protein [Gaiella sp.]
MAGLVVVGVDGSANGREALRFALAEAALRDARLGIVHSWSIPPLTATGIGMIPAFGLLREELAAAAAETLEGELERVARGATRVELERHVVQGDAAGALVERAAGADLLVVGSRGHGAVASTVLGSVSRACLHHAPCPVAVVNVAHHAEHARIVVGVDDSPGARHALAWAFAEARLRGADVHAVCAYDEPFALGAAGLSSPEVVVELRDALAEEANAVVERMRDSAPQDVVVTGEAVHGPAGQVLVAAAADAGLLVVGSRGRGGFKSLLLGSVSQHCAARSGGVAVVVRAA